MISQVDLARSLDAFAPQSAATPARSSEPLPPARAPGERPETTPVVSDVSISDEGIRRLQREGELEQQQAATLKAVSEDAELAAQMAHELAYRREVIVVPATAYTNLATSLYVSGTSPAINATSIANAQSELEKSRLARIALYELESGRGTPPAEIYNRLLVLATARPAGYSIAIVA
ncbi:MAG: hypothetical protein NT042_06450 [Sulfuritalea sp.]|nr:hypothetical protein [Sulfuritalea sp.]